MSYNILQAKIEYKNGKLNRITVLVDCTGGSSRPYSDVRAIYATAKPCAGYMFILPSHTLSEDLLQRVAGGGMETDDRDKIFPCWKKSLAITAD